MNNLCFLVMKILMKMLLDKGKTRFCVYGIDWVTIVSHVSYRLSHLCVSEEMLKKNGGGVLLNIMRAHKNCNLFSNTYCNIVHFDCRLFKFKREQKKQKSQFDLFHY